MSISKGVSSSNVRQRFLFPPSKAGTASFPTTWRCSRARRVRRKKSSSSLHGRKHPTPTKTLAVPIHPFVGRLWHLMRLEGSEDFDETWVADHPCYGHNPEDIMPFHSLFLEDGTGYQVNNHGLQEQIEVSPMNEYSRIFVMLKALHLPTFPPSGAAIGFSRTPIRNITTNRLEKLH